ncbi:transmembrane protein, putative (macronuclear) [Tetrahymena thermophila SB210]|uniref:Transmembrane protein, putative n=1 Tax=Tetrahymena thermophila (strain SB210) TaxID=312017 RepID=Q23RJ0_TETTS|nr:transmembrane protein, putative [Tetrahymena thermophila SB210]EAR99058.2 transmembrane protein, putative [Tetrahymena thermophila SB210]|eukprot:XP_001019303.2 transmembrane protein, putative [Tetrahymena thermophila SB210]
MKNSSSIKGLIFIVVIAVLIANVQNCQIISCVNENEGNDGACFDYENINKEIKMFPHSCQNCQLQLNSIIKDNGDINQEGIDSYDKCSSSPVSFKSYNGQSCEQNSDCISSKCEGKICKGKSLLEDCDDDSQLFCDSNLSCVNKKCQKVKQEGEQCQNTSDCDNKSFCYNNKCVKYGSLSDGEKVEGNSNRVEIKCSSFLVDKNGTCVTNGESIVISSCPLSKKCSSDETFSCNIFTNQQVSQSKGGITKNIKAYIEQVLQKILSLNQLCPNSLKFSHSCHLISDQIAELNEINTLYQNISRLLNMPQCMQNQLKYQNLYKLFSTESKQVEGQVIGDISPDSNSESSNQMFILILVFLVILTAAAAGYFFIKKRSIQKAEDPQIISETQESANKRNNSTSKKDKNVNISAQNKEALNLEYNPTSAKGDNQIDISNLQGIQDPKKNGHLETSVNQNFFSIDGEDEKEGKIVDSYEDNQSESDNGVSYENVFNIEGENIDKPNSQRKKRRQTNRKKIVKKDSEKKYEVVEE